MEYYNLDIRGFTPVSACINFDTNALCSTVNLVYNVPQGNLFGFSPGSIFSSAEIFAAYGIDYPSSLGSHKCCGFPIYCKGKSSAKREDGFEPPKRDS